MEAETETRAKKRSYDSAFNHQTQTPQNNELMMMDSSNSHGLLVPPEKHTWHKADETTSSGSNSQGLVVPPKKQGVKPKKQLRPRGQKQTFDEGGCGSNADKTMLSKLLDFLKTDMKYKDITDAKIISEKKLTYSNVKYQQGRLAENGFEPRFLPIPRLKTKRTTWLTIRK